MTKIINHRVRREELYRSQSPSEVSIDEPANQLLQARLEEVYGAIAPALITEEDDSRLQNEPETERDGFEFRLFSKPTSASQSKDIKDTAISERQRINIRTPTPDAENAGFLQPHRSDSYYIQTELSAVERDQYEAAAVSGEDVKRLANQPCVRRHRSRPP